MKNVTVPNELSCNRCEARLIEIAAATGNVASMMKLALYGRSKGARSRASRWLREICNVRVAGV